MSESRLMARGHPLEARAIGLVGGRVLVARSNHDIVEVRDQHGALVMRHVVALDGEHLMGALAFVGGRYLVVELVQYIFPVGVRAWDFHGRCWCPSVLDHGPDVALVGVCEQDVFVADANGVDLVDVARGKVVSRHELGGVWCASACAEAPGLVALGGDAGMIGDVDLDRPGAVVTVRDGVRIAGRLIDTWEPPVAWVGRATLLVGMRGRLVALDPVLEREREIVDLGSRIHALDVFGLRWVRAVTDADEVLVDLVTSRVVGRRGATVFVSADGSHAYWADRTRVDREPLPK